MDPQLEEPDLRSYLAVIARRRWLVILTALLFVGAAIAISLIPEPKYRVRAQVLTTGVNDPVSMIFGANNAGDLDRQASNQVAFLDSSTMRFAVGDAYNGSLPTSKIYDVAISAADSDNENVTSSVVNLSLVSSDPEAAATLVNVYANTYVALRQADDAEKLTNTRAQLQARLTQIDAEIDDIRSELTDIDAQIAAAARAAGRAGIRPPSAAGQSQHGYRAVDRRWRRGAELGRRARRSSQPQRASQHRHRPGVRPLPRVGAGLHPRLLRRLGEVEGDGRPGHRRVDAGPDPEDRRLVDRVGHGRSPVLAGGRSLPVVANVGEVPGHRAPGSGRPGHQPVDGRRQDVGGGQPGRRLRAVGRPGRRRGRRPAAATHGGDPRRSPHSWSDGGVDR